MTFVKRKRDYPWLVGDDKGAYCGPCKKWYEGKCSNTLNSSGGVFVTVPFSNWKKSAGSKPEDNKLLKHQQSACHKFAICSTDQAEQIRRSEAGSVVSLLHNCSDEQKRENFIVLTHFARMLYFMVKNEIPHTTCYPSLIQLASEIDRNGKLRQWLSAAPDNANYSSTTIATELLDCFGEYFSGFLKQEIVKSKYVSIIADEATDVRVRQELAVCCRYVDDEGNIKEAFLGLKHLQSTTAESIVEQLLNVLQRYDIPHSKVQWQSYDGAANFSGKKNGVQAIVKRQHFTEARYIHCRSHLLNLAAVGAANCFPKVKRLYSSLNSLWRFFHSSPKRMKSFNSVQSILKIAYHSLVEAADARWSSHYNSVKVVCSNLPTIIASLQDIYQSGDHFASETGGLLLTFHDVSFIQLLLAVQDILNPLNILCLQLQSKSLCLADIPEKVDAVIFTLQTIYDNPQSYLSSVETFLSQCGELGVEIIGSTDYALHTQLVQPYVEKLIKNIKQRLKNDGMTTISTAQSIFDEKKMEDYLDYGSDKIVLISREFGLNENDCLMEWKVFRNYMKQHREDESATILRKLAMRSDMAEGFPLLHDIACRVLCAPLGTASVERSFSCMNRICTRLRQRLLPEHLSDAMIISSESPTSFNKFEDIVILWHAKKPRRIAIKQ